MADNWVMGKNTADIITSHVMLLMEAHWLRFLKFIAASLDFEGHCVDERKINAVKIVCLKDQSYSSVEL